MRGRIVAVVCGAALAGLAAGCAQSVPGTAYAEGEGPTAASVQAGDAPDSGAEPGTSPPSSFTVPGPLPPGRPTVTVQPEPETARPEPGPPTTRYPMPFDDPPPGLTTRTPGATTPTPSAPGPDRRAAPDPAGESTRTVPPRRSRTATVAPRPDRPTTAPRPAEPRLVEPTPPRSVAGPLTSDVVPDECLIDGAGFRALLGAAVTAPTNHVVTRPDGSRTRSCFAATSSGSPAPTASVNVYRVNTGTPVAFLRTATGSRPLPGAGEGAVLVDTVAGPTVQVATPRLLITIAVANHTPSEATWREAARAAVAALPRR